MGVELFIGILAVLVLTDGVTNTRVFNSRPRVAKIVQLAICFLLLWVVLAFRDLSIIKDTCLYYAMHWCYAENEIPTEGCFTIYQTQITHFNGLYMWLSTAVYRYVWSDAFAMIFITATAVVAANLWFYQRYEPRHVALACFFLFFFIVEMCGQMRQAYAMILFFIAFPLLERRKILPYYMLMALAVAFHRSAIPMLLLPVTLLVPFKRRNVSIVIALTVVLTVAMFPLCRLLGLEDIYYVQLSIEHVAPAYGAWLNMLLAAAMIFAIFWANRRYGIALPSRLQLWCIVLCFCLLLLNTKILVIVRFAKYLMPVLVLLFIRAMTAVRSASAVTLGRDLRPVVLWGMVAVFFVRALAILLLRPEWYCLTPYSFYDFAEGWHNVDFGYEFTI